MHQKFLRPLLSVTYNTSLTFLSDAAPVKKLSQNKETSNSVIALSVTRNTSHLKQRRWHESATQIVLMVF